MRLEVQGIYRSHGTIYEGEEEVGEIQFNYFFPGDEAVWKDLADDVILNNGLVRTGPWRADGCDIAERDTINTNILAQKFYEASGLRLSHAHDKPKIVAGLEDIMPDIRAQVAAEIRAEMDRPTRIEMAVRYAGYYQGQRSGLEIAAQIAKNGPTK